MSVNPKDMVEAILGKGPLALFRDRLEREGRLEMYQMRQRALRESGLQTSQASAAARREFGYKGPKIERELADQAINVLRIAATEEPIREHTRAWHKKKKQKTFEEAFNSFPQTAAIDVDMGWVQSHPAMNRFERQILEKDQDPQPILISVRDLYDANGPAPSKRAINMLQSWVNRPTAFFSKLIDDHKKHTSTDVGKKDGRQSDAVVKDDVSSIERMLDSLEPS